MIRNSITIIPAACLLAAGLTLAPVLVVLPGGTPSGVAAARGSPPLIHGQTMGTYFRVAVAGAAVPPLEELQTDIAAVLDGVDRHMSTYRSDSTLSWFNAAPSGTWVSVTDSLVEVVSLARAVSEASRGAFDVTAGPLVNLWGFGPDGQPDRSPSTAQLAAARRLVSFRHLEVRDSPPALRKDLDGMYVDLSAVAKGYAVDAVSRLLEVRGIHDYLVDIGGELRGAGRNSNGAPWSVAIETPDEASGRNVRRIIRLGDRAVATSGDYRNFLERDGRRYPHVIDPRDGRPVAHGLASVTVIAETAALADAYATAVLVLGAGEGLALLERQGLHGVVLRRTPDGFEERFTAGFDRFLAADP